MGESRRQRRARERAAWKAAKRCGAAAPSSLLTDQDIADPGRPRDPEGDFYDVELWRTTDDLEKVTGWIAEGGLRSANAGVQFDWTASLSDLVAAVRDEVGRWRTRYPDLPIVWTLADRDEDVFDLAAREGVTLPQ